MQLSCTKSDDGLPDPEDTKSPLEVTSSCGIVHDGKLKNPIKLKDGDRIVVDEILGNNLLRITSNEKKFSTLVKLHGVASESGSKRDSAIRELRQLTSRGELYFFRAEKNCQINFGGGQAAVGSIINGSRQVVSEELVRLGFSAAEANDVCGGEKIGFCLKALAEQGPSEEDAIGSISRALWKPVSDSDGKLAIHVDAFGATVIVNGERSVKDQGPGNGYGSLSRFSKQGCAYGNNVRIQILDKRSGKPYLVGGKTTSIVPRGCGRHCLQNGNWVACSKK
ncbi:MAG TPA: hypothetical protein PKA79_01740 [Oligoflexia bacterium]|nr:hypothetical protein [Oligoflexia bacterium]